MQRNEKYKSVDPDPELYAEVEALLDEAEDVFEDEGVEQALIVASKARAVLDRGELCDPEVRVELHFLLGDCLFEIGDVKGALNEYREIRRLDPDNEAVSYFEARAHFHNWEFDKAEALFRRQPDLAELRGGVHYYLGLLHERRGRTELAEEHFATAHREDPEAYPLPLGLGSEEAAQALAEVVNQLPKSVRVQVTSVTISIQRFPDVEQFSCPEIDPLVLGLSVWTGSADAPSPEALTIQLFQGNIARICESKEQFRNELRQTLVCELAECFEWDEDRRRELGVD